MKIVDLKTYVVGNPWKNWVFIEIDTDEGISGLGEATRGLATKPVESALQEMKHLLIGENPLHIRQLRDKLAKALFLPHDADHMHALSAVDIACWDIMGKALNAPLYQLLGGACRPSIRAYANGWYQGPRDPSFFRERAQEVVSKGYTALKFDPFGNAYRTITREEEKISLECVAAVREAVGDTVDILIEGHDRFSVSTAKRLGYKLAEYEVGWFETPVLSYDIPATKEVARSIPVPVASGERFTSTRQVADLLEGDAVDIVQPETLQIGGVTGVQEACAIATARNASVAIHNAQSPLCTAVAVHIAITQPNALIQETFDDFHVDWAQDVVEGAPKVKDGFLEPSDKPGIGVELDEILVEKYPYQPTHFLRLFEAGWERRRPLDVAKG